jgi:hypothetical protein
MTTQVTLISLYGEKSKDFEAVITQCQQLVAQAVDSFTPYEIRQIHATVIGLERQRAPAYNANFLKYRGRDVAMDFDGFFAYLRGFGDIPIEVQLGGFTDREYPFSSRETRPYERSFSVQGDKVVVMGWPVRGAALLAPPATDTDALQEARLYPPTLDLIRRAAQDYGILHGYHRAATDVDNDLFFRIGLVDPKAMTRCMTSAVEVQTRQILSAQRPVVIEVRLEDIYIAAYEDDRLPISSTRTWSLADPEVTGSFVAGLFG